MLWKVSCLVAAFMAGAKVCVVAQINTELPLNISTDWYRKLIENNGFIHNFPNYWFENNVVIENQSYYVTCYNNTNDEIAFYVFESTRSHTFKNDPQRVYRWSDSITYSLEIFQRKVLAIFSIREGFLSKMVLQVSKLPAAFGNKPYSYLPDGRC